LTPASSGDLLKLREAIRQQNRERLVQHAGDGYGDHRDAVDSPFNVRNLALRIYERRQFREQMRMRCARLTTTDHTNDTNGMF